MLEVKINKLKERIALVQLFESGESVSATFHYQQAKEVINKILREQGVFLGRISQPLPVRERHELVEKITKAHNTVNQHIAADVEVDAYFSKTYGKWVIKITNRFGKVRFLGSETVNGFLTEIKRTRALVFQDQTVAYLSEPQVASLALKLCAARQRVVTNNQPLMEDKPWLKQTLVLDA